MTTTMALPAVRALIPSLTNAWRKGQHGRIGIVGGSVEYTGAPFYAGMASLKTGADLCHIFCAEEAAIPIKCYSPELIVHPLLRSDAALERYSAEERENAIHRAVARITDVLGRVDTLVMGPGLGRDSAVFAVVRKLICHAHISNTPLILDGDALYLVSTDPEIVRGNRNAILTPNAMEYARICVAVGLLRELNVAQATLIAPSAVSQALQGPIVVRKGIADVISDGTTSITQDASGCPRRCGGQGDVLTGTIATFASWASSSSTVSDEWSPLLLAAFGGSLLTRSSAHDAFERHGRSMTAPDIIQGLGTAFVQTF
ncbi:TPA: hypothetical protein N0F65_001142 [Lagenidium giganteum]|uniref:ATP-dependent (S)-NAD(P)H-hydrate dehydratase n=1 Tax=Lagenidium giganteum TaxID=4803 RepID=A0AAV2YXX4_9STRA|nr:TPA: hypothetical protein N0F65_001142 [Lagenidium giganteum]